MGGQRLAPSLLHLLLSVLLATTMSQLWAFPFSASLDLDVTPRTTVFSKGEVVAYRHNYSTEGCFRQKGTGKINLNYKIYLLILYDSVA